MTFAGEFLGLPGLRGYWPMGAFDGSGNAIDQSGHARTLTYNGNPTYNFHASGAPYLALDGTGDYLSRADESGLDILGTETYITSAVRGLTFGGWFFITNVTVDQSLIGKFNVTGNQRAYLINVGGSQVQVQVSSNGTATTAKVLGTPVNSTWHFVAGRFIPSTSLTIFLDDASDVNTTSIPASIFNSTATFEIGARSAGSTALLTGRASNCFLCAMALSDTAIDNIYQNTKASYGL